MDEISKENVLNPEAEVVQEVLPVQENTEAEVPAQELGEVPSVAPQQTDGQNTYAEEVQGEVIAEEEVNQEVLDVAHLPQEEKLAHLKDVAQKSSLEKAIKMVKKMNDPWLEDKLHDELIDDPDFRVKLEQLGKIEKL